MICRKCGKADQVVEIEALAACTNVHIFGLRVPFAPPSEDPQMFVITYCQRCRTLITLPVMKTTLQSKAVQEKTASFVARSARNSTDNNHNNNHKDTGK